MGRPSLYTPELVEAICARLSEGEPLAVICREPGMPGVTTVWDWEQRHEGVSEAIARAREAGEAHIGADCLTIIDEQPPSGPMGGTDSGYVQWQRARVETRLKLLAKWNPRKWGDKVQQEFSGSVTVKNSAADLTDDQLAALAVARDAQVG